MRRNLNSALLFILLAALSACASQSRGMVEDPETGLLYGSAIDNNITIDPSEFENAAIKVNIRNTSGDPNFDLYAFRDRLEQSYRAKGYEPTRGNDYGLRVDVNVVYSGHVSENVAGQYGLLGAAAGGVGGYVSPYNGGAAVGAISGAALGAILGSYITDDTYIVVAETTLHIMRHDSRNKQTTIVFTGSPEKEKKTNFHAAGKILRAQISVYAGGRNVEQREIVQGVQQRFARILSDVI